MRKAVLIGVLGLLSAAGVSAQETSWTAYERSIPYGHEAVEFKSSGSTGETLTVVIPPAWENTPQFYNQSDVNQFELAPAGDLMVYSLGAGGPDIMYYTQDPYQESLIAYDTNSQTVVIDYAAGPFATFLLNRHAFDPVTGQFFVVVSQPATLTDETGTELSRDMLEYGDKKIEVLLFDPKAGSGPIATLTDDSLNHLYFETTVHIDQLRDRKAFFTVITSGGDARSGTSYVWDIATNDLSEALPYQWASDIFDPTGEAIRVRANREFPMAEDVGVDPELFHNQQRNMVEVYEASSDTWQPFYHDASLTFSGAWFVQNGERVLISAYTADDTQRWFLLERDGTLVDESPTPDARQYSDDVLATVDGFLYTKHQCLAYDSCTEILENKTRDNDLDNGQSIMTLEGDHEIIWLKSAEPLQSEYINWTFRPHP